MNNKKYPLLALNCAVVVLRTLDDIGYDSIRLYTL
jgi:hypothetical protein